MKKYVTLLAVALLSHTSLGNAVKFDPTTAGAEEFAAKNRKLTLKLFTPNLSPEEQEAIQDQIGAVTTMADFKFASNNEKVKLLEALENAYNRYIEAKSTRLCKKHKVENFRVWLGNNNNHRDAVKSLLQAQYHDSSKEEVNTLFGTASSFGSSLSHDPSEDLGQLGQFISRFKINIDPLTFMKMLESEGAEAIASTMNKILTIPEQKVSLAFTYVDAKSQDVQRDLKPLKEAFQGVKEDDQSLTRQQLRIIRPFHEEEIVDHNKWVITDKGFTIPDGISIAWSAQRPLVMNRVSENDVCRLVNGKYFLKTNVGTANYSFMSDPISIEGLSRISARLAGDLGQGGLGIGFLTENQAQWLVHKPVLNDEYGWATAQVDLPPSAEKKVILVLTNNQPNPARSMLEILRLRIDANKRDNFE